MKKNLLNEEISRIKGMMKQLNEDSFENTDDTEVVRQSKEYVINDIGNPNTIYNLNIKLEGLEIKVYEDMLASMQIDVNTFYKLGSTNPSEKMTTLKPEKIITFMSMKGREIMGVDDLGNRWVVSTNKNENGEFSIHVVLSHSEN
jgi:hypothetical protein